MAENKYGVSEPATTEDPIKARHPFGSLRFIEQEIVFKIIPLQLNLFFP